MLSKRSDTKSSADYVISFVYNSKKCQLVYRGDNPNQWLTEDRRKRDGRRITKGGKETFEGDEHCSLSGLW